MFWRKKADIDIHKEQKNTIENPYFLYIFLSVEQEKETQAGCEQMEDEKIMIFFFLGQLSPQ